VVIARDVDEVRLRPLERTEVRAVDTQLDLVIDRCECTLGVRIRPRDVLDGVVERELLREFTGRNTFLNLRDENVVFPGRHDTPLLVIEVIIVRVRLNIIVTGVGTPIDAKFHGMVLERHEWNGGLGTFAKKETEWVEVRACARTRVRSVGTLGYVLCTRIDGDLLGEEHVLSIDHLTTDEKLHPIDDRAPLLNIDRPLIIVECEIRVSEQITVPFKLDS